MKSAAVLVLLSSFCSLLRADLLVSIDTSCQATPSGSSTPVYTESHSAAFPNGLPEGTPVPGINCSTPYGSLMFGVYADQTATGVEMSAGTTLQSAANYSLTGSVDLRASTPQEVYVAVGGTGTAYLQGFTDCGGDAGFEGGAIQVSTVSLTGPLAQPCNPGPGAMKFPIVFGQPFTYGWQGEIAFQFQSPGLGDAGFYLFDNNTVTLAPIVDQNGNPIAGAHLVAVPEPESFVLIVAALVLVAVRIGSGHGRDRFVAEAAVLRGTEGV